MIRINKPTYAELMQKLIQEYRDGGNTWPASKRTMAKWAIDNGKWHRHGSALIQLCANDIARAMRQEYYTDPQGRRCRTKIAARFRKPSYDGTDRFETLWGDVRTEDRDFVEVGFSNKRGQIAGEVKQLGTDVDSFNDNYNTGAPIQLSFDFTADYEESKQSSVYKFGRVK